MYTKQLIGSVAVVAVLVGSATFYGGMKYGQMSRQSGFQARTGEGRTSLQNAGAQGGNFSGIRGGGGFVVGEIIAKDDQSITVKLQDGGSKIIFFSGDTEVSKTSEGSASDVMVGKDVMVTGTVNQDGTVSAQIVQIRLEGMNWPRR